MKKLLALALILVMALSVLPAMAADGLNKDADILLWLTGNGSVPGYEEGATENDNRFINAIREATGYKNLKVYVMPATDSRTFIDTSISAGDYPDAIYVNGNHKVFLDYQVQGFWQPVDEAVEKYGPAISALMSPQVWAMSVGEDGLHYSLPIPRHTSYNGKFLTNGIMYRSDLFEGLGIEYPTDAASFRAMLEKVKEVYPDMIPYANTSLNSGRMKDAFGMWREFYVEDGTVKSTWDLYLKDYLEFMHGLYADGLLDPESAYQTSAQRREKITAGKVFAWDDGVWTKEIRQAWKADGIEWTYDFLPELENIDGTKGEADASPAANEWMFPATSKCINEVIDIINTFVSDTELEEFINYGVKGEHYTVDENGVYQTIPGYESVIYKIYYRFWFKPEVWWNNAVLGDFVTEIESWWKATEGSDNINLFGVYMPSNDAETEYRSTINDIYNEYTEKIIAGDLSIDAYDEMIKKIYQSGYGEILAAAQEWYDGNGKVIEADLLK